MTKRPTPNQRPTRDRIVTIPLTDEERDALHRLAAEADLSMVQLVRRWIRDASAKKGV